MSRELMEGHGSRALPGVATLYDAAEHVPACCEASMMHEYRAYTDGACLGNPGPGGWGVRLYCPDGQVREWGGRELATTNNRMEMQAAIHALQSLPGQIPVTVYTDSQYLINGITKWLSSWRRRGWVTASGTPVKNSDLWQILASLQHRGVRWQHVRGHSGNPNNERVDTIARDCATGRCPTLFCGQVGAPDDPVPLLPAMPASSVTTSPELPRTPLDGAARYVSIVRGQVACDRTWAACAARVRGVSGAKYRKVRTQEEFAAFCAAHGVEPPATT